jgi:hypothetical protein
VTRFSSFDIFLVIAFRRSPPSLSTASCHSTTNTIFSAC